MPHQNAKLIPTPAVEAAPRDGASGAPTGTPGPSSATGSGLGAPVDSEDETDA